MPKDRRNAGEAYKLGQSGENAPDWVLEHPGHLASFRQGQQTADQAGVSSAPTGPTAGTTPTPEGRTPAAGNRNPAAPPPRSGKGPLNKAAGAVGGRAQQATAAKLPRSVSRSVPIPGGDAGGLVLALVLYPLALSVIRYGGAGPGMWFRAKFLNKPGQPAIPPGQAGDWTTGAQAGSGGDWSIPNGQAGNWATGTPAGPGGDWSGKPQQGPVAPTPHR